MRQLIPFLFTSGNMFCGFVSIILVSQQRFIPACYAIVIAGLMDGLDGIMARLLKTKSSLGLELDSLADIVSFGIAPAFLLFKLYLEKQGAVGYLILFLFIVAGAIRLARFNIKSLRTPQTYRTTFQGLPITVAGMLIATIPLVTSRLLPDKRTGLLLPIILLGLSFLMLSPIRYRKLERLLLVSQALVHSIFSIFILLPSLIIIILYGVGMFLFSALSCYIILEPILYIRRRCNR